MKTSVALATFNGAAFLEEQLQSIALQTQLPDELVVGDDCSSDDTIAILNKFSAAAPFPVRISINEKNLGFERNFSQILSRCAGDIIFFCDQDDVWYSEKIAICCAQFDPSGEPRIISHDAHLADRANVQTGLTLSAQFEAAGGARGDMVYGCCLAFDRFFARLFPADLAHSHDGWLVEIGRLLGARHHVDLPLISYRRHGDNSTGSHQTRLSRTNKVLKIWERLIKARKVKISDEVYKNLQYIMDLAKSFEESRSDVINKFGSDRFHLAISDLENRKNQLMMRQAMYNLRRPHRIARIARLGMQGKYNGITALGFMRDVLESPRS